MITENKLSNHCQFIFQCQVNCLKEFFSIHIMFSMFNFIAVNVYGKIFCHDSFFYSLNTRFF